MSSSGLASDESSGVSSSSGQSRAPPSTGGGKGRGVSSPWRVADRGQCSRDLARALREEEEDRKASPACSSHGSVWSCHPGP